VACVAPKKIWAVGAVLGGVIAGHTRTASAHLVSTDLGPFYDGAAHPLVSPQDLLTILGLAILAAYGGATSGRRLIVSLTLAWATGVVVGFAMVGRQFDLPIATAGVILLLGVTGLFKMRVPSVALASVSVFIGLVRGVMNGSAARAADGQWLSVVGIVLGVFVLGTLLTGSSTWLTGRRTEVVLRVAGSWIAAIGLLMIGWEFRI